MQISYAQPQLQPKKLPETVKKVFHQSNSACLPVGCEEACHVNVVLELTQTDS